jgi:hypothetical protein
LAHSARATRRADLEADLKFPAREIVTSVTR